MHHNTQRNKAIPTENNETLDIEDEDARESRICKFRKHSPYDFPRSKASSRSPAGVLSRLNTASSQLSSPQPPTSFVFGERGPHGTDAPSERTSQLRVRFILSFFDFSLPTVLSRVQAFFPQLEASSRALLRRAQEDPSSVDIENVEECEEHYIEMVPQLLLS